MSTQKNMKVSILGKEYLLSTDENEQDICQAVQLVNDLCKGKVGTAASVAGEKVAVIVALQLAADLNKKLKELSQYKERIEQLTNVLEQEA